MGDQDLTPDEARVEIESFFGEGWRCIVTQAITRTAQPCHRFRVCAVRSGTTTQATGTTYRAAVDALKGQWRAAVRPLCLRTVEEASRSVVSWESSGGDCWAYEDDNGNPIDPEDIVHRALRDHLE